MDTEDSNTHDLMKELEISQQQGLTEYRTQKQEKYEKELAQECQEFEALIAEWSEASIRVLLTELSRLDKPFSCKLLRDEDLQSTSLLELFGFENSDHKHGTYGISLAKESEGRVVVEFDYYGRHVGDGATFTFSYSPPRQWQLLEVEKMWRA